MKEKYEPKLAEREKDFTTWNLLLNGYLDDIRLTDHERKAIQKAIDEMERIFREANV